MNITWLVIVVLIGMAPWIIRFFLPNLRIEQKEVFVAMAIAMISFSAFFFLGRYSQSLDHEIWSGQVTGKTREHGSYTRSYDCNCRQVCTGSGKDQSCSTQCDTCYEQHYTVTWKANSNIGSFQIEHYDSTSTTVYMTPDPNRYRIIQTGEPVSKKVAFTNYVKAVPESVFRQSKVDEHFSKMIPDYPGNIYDIYHINRVLSVGGAKVDDITKWNSALSLLLCDLGPTAKANIVIVFANTADAAFSQSLKASWLNGKKNDVIVVFGTTQYPKIDWVDVFGWTQAETFKVRLREKLMDEKTIDRDNVLKIIGQEVKTDFKYRDMEDFAYLSSAINPPTWLLILGIVLSIIFSTATMLIMRAKRLRY